MQPSLAPLLVAVTLAVAVAISPARAADGSGKPLKFDFGSGKAAEGFTQVTPDATYSAERGYGFEPGASLKAEDRGGGDALRGDFVTSDKPFYFSVRVPVEGNYAVTVTLGDPAGESETTVKSETRRLMVHNLKTARGEFATRTFTVNYRTPKIEGGSSAVRLLDREKSVLHWDDKLTLEFNGKRPCVTAVEIAPADVVTVYLAGDSTVTDQKSEPWAGWGQMLPRFFKPSVAIANHAESGRTLGSFRGDRRLDKVLSQVKPGDYLFIQFGHNDQKDKGPEAGPFKSYKSNLKQYVAAARERKAIPVLVTPMHRRRFDASGKFFDTMGDYPEAVRQVAKEDGVPVIDLNAMSEKFYVAMGPEPSKKAFVHFPANSFPNQPKDLKDDTHFSPYGGYELARCMVEGIRANVPELAKHLADDAGTFDPSKPDPFDSINIPPSPEVTATAPEGR